MNLMSVYEAGAVMRYHTKRTEGPRQTVADHTWGACVILLWLYHPDTPSSGQIQTCLLHDVPELITGDVPAPAKWRSAELKNALAALETEIAEDWGIAEAVKNDPIVNFCDNAELAMHSISRVRMGNLNYRRTAEIGIERCDHCIGLMSIDLARTIDRARNLILQLKEDLINVYR